DRIGEERIALEALLVVDVLVLAVAHDHVVQALERIARHLWALTHDLQIVFEAAFPVEVPVAFVVLQRSDARNHLVHESHPRAGAGMRVVSRVTQEPGTGRSRATLVGDARGARDHTAPGPYVGARGLSRPP